MHLHAVPASACTLLSLGLQMCRAASLPCILLAACMLRHPVLEPPPLAAICYLLVIRPLPCRSLFPPGTTAVGTDGALPPEAPFKLMVAVNKFDLLPQQVCAVYRHGHF